MKPSITIAFMPATGALFRMSGPAGKLVVPFWFEVCTARRTIVKLSRYSAYPDRNLGAGLNFNSILMAKRMPKRPIGLVIRQLVQTSYDPVAYWNSRRNPNSRKGESSDAVAADVSYIRHALGNGSRILELGPGVGRTFAAYQPGARIVTLDIAQSYQDRLASAALANKLELDSHYLDNPDGAFPFKDEAFDKGVASQVLLHVPPKTIRHTLSELARVCREVIVITRYSHGRATRSRFNAGHVFNHDYFSLLSSLGCSLHDLIKRDNKLYFIFRRVDANASRAS